MRGQDRIPKISGILTARDMGQSGSSQLLMNEVPVPHGLTEYGDKK